MKAKPGEGNSASARKRRRRADAKAGWAAVVRFHELQAAAPKVRRRVNAIKRHARRKRIERERAEMAAFADNRPVVE